MKIMEIYFSMIIRLVLWLVFTLIILLTIKLIIRSFKNQELVEPIELIDYNVADS